LQEDPIGALAVTIQVLGMAMVISPALASDPITGTWKLDLDNSKFVLPPPKEQTEVYRELVSGEIEMSLTRVQSDGASRLTKLTWPASGGVVHDPDGHLPKDETLVEPYWGPVNGSSRTCGMGSNT
jgi:hypothetical protein